MLKVWFLNPVSFSFQVTSSLCPRVLTGQQATARVASECSSWSRKLQPSPEASLSHWPHQVGTAAFSSRRARGTHGVLRSVHGLSQMPTVALAWFLLSYSTSRVSRWPEGPSRPAPTWAGAEVAPRPTPPALPPRGSVMFKSLGSAPWPTPVCSPHLLITVTLFPCDLSPKGPFIPVSP